jgi:hypothetical protein
VFPLCAELWSASFVSGVRGEGSGEEVEAVVFDVVNVPQRVVLFEEFLQEFLPSIEWLGSEILIAES